MPNTTLFRAQRTARPRMSRGKGAEREEKRRDRQNEREGERERARERGLALFLLSRISHGDR